jgi:hypothetical protein
MEPEVTQYKQLGWANSWKEIPAPLRQCAAKQHKIEDRDIGPPMRGMDHRCRCHICKIEWHYDSSD